MFKNVFYFLLFICTPLFAGVELSSFKSITQELDIGNEVVIVVHNAQCIMDDPNTHKIPASTMFIKPAALLFTESKLVFDVVKFSAGGYPLPENGIIQRGTFLLNSDGQVNIIIASFDAVTNQKSPQMKDVKIQCQLGDGVKVYQHS